MLALMLALSLHSCGTERWSTKTLTDAEAAKVDLSHAVTSTVESLRALPAPRYDDHNPRAEPEKTVYSVNAQVVAFKMEADRDFHVVIAGGTGQTMIAEFPDPQCARGSRVAASITSARAAFVKRFGQPTPKLKRLKKPVPVTVIGVGFFDRCHGQTGRAPNCVELHPVIAISLPRPPAAEPL